MVRTLDNGKMIPMAPTRPRLSRLTRGSLLCLLMFQLTLWARDKTDVIILKNGDHVTGEITRLDRGKLILNTDSMGKVSIEWNDIETITSRFPFEVELADGQSFFGTIEPGSGERTIQVVGASASGVLEHDSVVKLTPIEDSFWERLDGSISVGFSFQRANRVRNWTLDAEASQRTRKRYARVALSSLFSDQKGVESTTRNVLGGEWRYFFGKRWFAAALGQFSQNEELGLDFRSNLGGGVGRDLIRTNRTVLSSLGGLLYNRERFSGETAGNHVEGLWGLDYALFIFDDPETDISTRLAVVPSLSTPGRVRIDLETRIRYEIFKDFFWSVSLFDNYDSEPTGASAEKNDYGVTTSLGYRF